MDVFLTLLFNLFPLYVLIALGFVAGRKLGVERDSLARVAIFMCMPIVMFGFVAQMKIEPSYFFLTLSMLIVHFIVGFTMWQVGQKIYPDNRANLLSMCATMGNTGYMGLPVVLLLFGEELAAIYMLLVLSNVLYEATFNYYVAARSQFTVKKSIQKLFSFPVVYAVILGFAVNFSGLALPEVFDTYWHYFKGAYVVLGMMIIGAALAASDKLEIAPRFLGLVFVGKFVLWPMLAGAFIYIDSNILNFFNEDIYKLIVVLSIVPTAANVAAFSAQFNVRPEKAATTILAGTLFALFYIPLVLVLFGLY